MPLKHPHAIHSLISLRMKKKILHSHMIGLMLQAAFAFDLGPPRNAPQDFSHHLTHSLSKNWCQKYSVCEPIEWRVNLSKNSEAKNPSIPQPKSEYYSYGFQGVVLHTFKRGPWQKEAWWWWGLFAMDNTHQKPLIVPYNADDDQIEILMTGEGFQIFFTWSLQSQEGPKSQHEGVTHVCEFTC